MAISQFRCTNDYNYSAIGEIIYPPTYVNAYVLTGGAAATLVTVPTGARIAMFSSTNNFYANWLTTAATPVADITSGAAPELNPVSRDVTDYTTFSVIAPVTCVLTISYFS